MDSCLDLRRHTAPADRSVCGRTPSGFGFKCGLASGTLHLGPGIGRNCTILFKYTLDHTLAAGTRPRALAQCRLRHCPADSARRCGCMGMQHLQACLVVAPG